MFRPSFPGLRHITRRFCTASSTLTSSYVEQGYFSPEWWLQSSAPRTVFSASSTKDNAVVSVLSRHSRAPAKEEWPKREEWLNKRYAKVTDSGSENCQQEGFKVIGFEWRTLNYNHDWYQAKVKVVAASRESEPGSVFLKQQQKWLYVDNVQSMVYLGLVTLKSCGYHELPQAMSQKKPIRILCVGLDGGSVPLYLAHRFPGATIDIVEIDPLIISVTNQEMGFPALPVVTSSGERTFPADYNNVINKMLWGDILDRLHLYENDPAKFLQDTDDVYDMIFINAYGDGMNDSTSDLCDPDSPFLKALGDRLHPKHGTVAVNIRWDPDDVDSDDEAPAEEIGQAYKDALVGDGSICSSSSPGVGFIYEVDNENAILVVGRGFIWEEVDPKHHNKDPLTKTLQSNSLKFHRRLISNDSSLLVMEKKRFTLID
ncbi:hypothetical protein Tsubulata_045377 [Turnera subulata]|uniref:PABS domain-containing protein n=1 Tax=Turnera subulata TaxID=218843 RepID=A0A9Q0FK15_9ROSI|nr:hypothetical protein Tsubulata_045377 [Turnera subulata]